MQFSTHYVETVTHLNVSDCTVTDYDGTQFEVTRVIVSVAVENDETIVTTDMKGYKLTKAGKRARNAGYGLIVRVAAEDRKRVETFARLAAALPLRADDVNRLAAIDEHGAHARVGMED